MDSNELLNQIREIIKEDTSDTWKLIRIEKLVNTYDPDGEEDE